MNELLCRRCARDDPETVVAYDAVGVFSVACTRCIALCACCRANVVVSDETFCAACDKPACHNCCVVLFGSVGVDTSRSSLFPGSRLCFSCAMPVIDRRKP